MCNFWDEKYKNSNFEWGLEPSLVGETALRKAKEHGYDRALDIGCGYGRDVLYLASHGIRAEGIDNSEAGIRMALNLAESRGLETRFILGDALVYAFEAEGYDLVLMSFARHLMPRPERQKLIDIIENLLEPGGTVIDMVPSVRDENYGMGEELEEGTYLLHGRAMHYFTGKEMRNDYRSMAVDVLEEVKVFERHSDGRAHHHWTRMLVAHKQGPLPD